MHHFNWRYMTCKVTLSASENQWELSAFQKVTLSHLVNSGIEKESHFLFIIIPSLENKIRLHKMLTDNISHQVEDL